MKKKSIPKIIIPKLPRNDFGIIQEIHFVNWFHYGKKKVIVK